MTRNYPEISLLIILISTAVLSYGLNLPFAGHHDWNSVMYANVARNHLRYGLQATKLGMVVDFGYNFTKEFAYFTHYPPLMPLLIAASFAAFGIHEWSARLVPIISSVIMIYFLYKLASRLWNLRTGIFAACFLTFSPMLLYFSKIPVHETIILGFHALTVWFYYLWLKSEKNKYFWGLIIFLVIGQLTSWSGYYFSLYLPLHYLLIRRQKLPGHQFQLIFIFLLAPFLFLLHNLHINLVTGGSGKLWEVLLFRLNLGSEAAPYQITIFKFIGRQAKWIATYFTLTNTFLSLIWFITLFNNRQHVFKNSFVLLLLVFGFTHNLIFRHLAYIHDYMLIYALPFFALSAAAVLNRFYNKFIYIAFLLLIIFAIERLPYVNKLFHTGDNNPAVILGKSLNQLSQIDDHIAVLSTDFMQYYDVFIRYYADRVISAADPSDLSNFDFVVVPLGVDQISLPQFKSFPTKFGIIYDLKQKI